MTLTILLIILALVVGVCIGVLEMALVVAAQRSDHEADSPTSYGGTDPDDDRSEETP